MGARTYTPGGKGHHVLSLLDNGQATFADITRVLGVAHAPVARRKSWYVVQALGQDGLITLSAGSYAITERGEALLADLRNHITSGEGASAGESPARAAA